MIPNPYYLGKLPLTFSNITRLVAYPFLNMGSTIITTTGGSRGVQASMMTPSVNAPIGELFTENLVPYFQPPTRNPPTGFSNYKHGIPMGGDGSPPHGSGGPLGGGSRPLGGGGGPLGRSEPPSGGGGGFIVGGASVPFGAP
jgi:hypothetical protein